MASNRTGDAAREIPSSSSAKIFVPATDTSLKFENNNARHILKEI